MAETTGQSQQIGTCSTCGWPLREGCAHFCSTGSARIQQTFGVPVAAKDAEIAQLRSENERLKAQIKRMIEVESNRNKQLRGNHAWHQLVCVDRANFLAWRETDDKAWVEVLAYNNGLSDPIYIERALTSYILKDTP